MDSGFSGLGLFFLFILAMIVLFSIAVGIFFCVCNWKKIYHSNGFFTDTSSYGRAALCLCDKPSVTAFWHEQMDKPFMYCAWGKNCHAGYSCVFAHRLHG